MRDRPADRQVITQQNPPLPPLHPNIQILIRPIPLVPDVEPGRVDDPPPPPILPRQSFVPDVEAGWVDDLPVTVPHAVVPNPPLPAGGLSGRLGVRVALILTAGDGEAPLSHPEHFDERQVKLSKITISTSD